MNDTDLPTLDDLLGPGGAIARRLSGYELRPQQIELARAVMAALDGGQSLLAEAGTGVGKSFAYLLPSILHALRHPERGPVVVSTRTIALQEQLEQRDLPFLQAVLPLEFTAVTAVGRNHYVCLRRMHLADGDRAALFPERALAGELDRVLAWAEHSHGGLRFELNPTVDDRVWDEVRAEHGNCLHKACPHYEGCPYQRSRRRLESAQVVVVNHALYMADVALRMAGAKYLPEHRAVVFDEAHHLERVATESLGSRLTLATVLWHLRRLHPKRRGDTLLTRYGSPTALLLVEQCRFAAEGFFARLEARMARSRAGQIALEPDDVLDETLSPVLGELAAEVVEAAAAATKMDHKMELSARARGLHDVTTVLSFLRGPVEPRIVRWIEQEKRGASLRSAPLDVGEALRDYVFGPPRQAILTSATLGPPQDRDFAWLRRRLGIDTAATLRLGSPFDYATRVRVTVASGMPDPGQDAAGFRRACVDEVRERVLANGGRALVLCTSWTLVRDLAEQLRDRFAMEGLRTLVQGEAPLRELLRVKRDEPTSVLIGTETFWEGIDVPGDALTLVIVTRFPFAQPDHPLTRARLAAIEARGGDAFQEHSLPEAILKFRQGFGRLVRSQADGGEVVILDPRARTRRYGRQFLEALPEGVVVED